MPETINGYLLEEPLKTDNSGFSKWGFGKLDGKEYFIKEFLSPAYPVNADLLGPELTAKKKEVCNAFVNQKCLLFQTINQASDGNLVRIEHFFRYGAKYYITMQKVEAVDMVKVLALPERQKIEICAVLAHAVAGMHQAGLIHGDIKLDNVIFCSNASGRIGAKMIDLDSCFWAARPPEKEEEIIGDQIYMAPETFLLMEQEEGTLTCKIDIFALGLLFHQIMTGLLPGFEDSCHYPYEALLKQEELKVSDRLDPRLHNIFLEMLQREPEKRPDADQVGERLRKLCRRRRSTAETGEIPLASEAVLADKKRSVDEFFFRAGEDDL